MLFEDGHFDEDHSLPIKPWEWGDHVFIRTTIDALDLEGLSFSGVMDSCTITSNEFYWGLFNGALVARTRFEACRFRSTSFRGSTLVDCAFVDCSFELDNIGGDCTIDGCLMAACRLAGCSWTCKVDGPRDITRTRWLGCVQENCKGLDGLF